MSKPFNILISLLFFSFAGNAQEEIVLKGVFQEKNLYLQNPSTPEGVGFCTYGVKVNGEDPPDYNGSGYEIDLYGMGFKKGDEIEVVVKHKSGCKPKILNPEVLRPTSTYKVVQMGIDPNGHLQWTTINENGSLDFIVEQYRWNKWIRVGVVKGKGTPKKNRYTAEVPFHSGSNRFRVKQIDHTGKPTLSHSYDYTPNNLPVVSRSTGLYAHKEFVFSSPTLYELYDFYGNLVKKGHGDKINVRNLKRGQYFLNYDNKSERFIKR